MASSKFGGHGCEAALELDVEFRRPYLVDDHEVDHGTECVVDGDSATSDSTSYAQHDASVAAPCSYAVEENSGEAAARASLHVFALFSGRRGTRVEIDILSSAGCGATGEC